MNKFIKNFKDDLKDLFTLQVFQADFSKTGLTSKDKMLKAKDFLTIFILTDVMIIFRTNINSTTKYIDISEIEVIRGTDDVDPIGWLYEREEYQKYKDLKNFYVCYWPKNVNTTHYNFFGKDDPEDLLGLEGIEYYNKFINLFGKYEEEILERCKLVSSEESNKKYGMVVSPYFERAILIGEDKAYTEKITERLKEKGNVLGITSYPFNIIRILELSEIVYNAEMGCAFIYYEKNLISIGWSETTKGKNLYIRGTNVGTVTNSKELAKVIKGALAEWTKRTNVTTKIDRNKFCIFYQSIDNDTTLMLGDAINAAVDNKIPNVTGFPLTLINHPTYNISIEEKMQFLKSIFI